MIKTILAPALALLLVATPALAQVGAAQRQSLFGQLHDQQHLLSQEHQQLEQERTQEQSDRQNLSRQFQLDQLQQQLDTQQLQPIGPSNAVR